MFIIFKQNISISQLLLMFFNLLASKEKGNSCRKQHCKFVIIVDVGVLVTIKLVITIKQDIYYIL